MTEFFETRVAGNLAEVQAALDAKLKSRGFGTLHTHDVRATLEAKGLSFATPLVIMDICNPGYAKRTLEATGIVSPRSCPAASRSGRKEPTW